MGTVRSNFERDYDRIIFSYPFRRLQDKTQVFPLPIHDFVHTRLTHSLEVSSVGRSLGKIVGEKIIQKHPELKEKGFNPYDFGAIVAAAALAHDIGNPPFGHSGEKAISDYFISGEGNKYKESMSEQEWNDLTHFEGNAQGFKLLNKKEYQGLRLTYATLLSFSKYPSPSYFPEKNLSRRSQKKYGFFKSENENFKALAEEAGLISLNTHHNVWCRHPLAFLVEAADDICYNIIDLEDGCRLGLVSFEEAKNLLVALTGDLYQPQKFEKIKIQDEKLGVLRAMAIGNLIKEVTEAFLNNEESILNGSFDKALTDLIPSTRILNDILSLSVSKIYRSRNVLEIEVAGFEVLHGLLHSFITASFNYINHKNNCSARDKSLLRLLPEEYKVCHLENPDQYNVIMNIIDFIASMTDKYAISLYRNIKGISISD